MADIFINYRTSDEAYAAVLLDEKLCERFGAERVFRDNRSIEPGVDFRPELWGRLAHSSVFIVVIGPGWLAADEHGRRRIDDPDDFVRREIVLALQVGIRVLPVLIGDVPELRASELPPELAALAHRQYRRLTPRGVRAEISRLVDEVATILAAATSRTGGPLADGFGGTTRAGRHDPPTQGGTAVLIHTGELPGRLPDPTLRTAVTGAATAAGLSDLEMTERDLGTALFVPASVPPIRVVTAFVDRLEATLAQACSAQVRVAICRGTGGDRGFGHAAELVHLPALKPVLGRASRARLVLAVSDAFFDEVVRRDPAQVDPSAFLPLATDAAGGRCWVKVPGYPAPPGLAGEPVADDVAAAAPAAGPAGVVVDHHGTAFINHGPMHGDQIAGDLVMGDKQHYGGAAAQRP